MAQPEDRAVLPFADRSRVGIRMPGGHDDGVLLRRRRETAGELRLLRRKQRGKISEGGQQASESVGAVRYARQRDGMDAGSIFGRFLWAFAGVESVESGHET